MFLDAFPINQPMTNYRTTDTYDTATGTVTPVEALVGTFNGFKWTGGNAESYVSDRLRSIMEGLVVVYPGTDVLEGDRVIINSEEYRIIGKPDDIAVQGEVLMFPVALYG